MALPNGATQSCSPNPGNASTRTTMTCQIQRSQKDTITETLVATTSLDLSEIKRGVGLATLWDSSKQLKQG
jgi:hypothetical protein